MQTHWKRLVNPDYIGAYSLDPGKDKIVTIIEVAKKRVKGTDGKEEECTVATLKDEKPFILNRTNCKTIAKIFNSPYIEDWAGKKITLYATTVKAFGDVVECLRIRGIKSELPKLIPKSDKWNQAVEYVSINGMDTLLKKYSMTEKDKETLISQAMELHEKNLPK
jgi:hypothetical protein